MTRVLSGIVAIPLVLGIVLYGSGWLFFALIAVLVLVGVREFFTMTDRIGTRGYPLVAALLSLLLLFCFKLDGRYLLEWGAVSLFALVLAWALTDNQVKVAFNQISYTLLGVFYVAGLSGYFILIHALENGRHWLIFLFLSHLAWRQPGLLWRKEIRQSSPCAQHQSWKNH